MKSQKRVVAGLYARLSRDDNNGNTISMSIDNQCQLLKDYALEKGWEVFDTYVDDGYSGTNFDRPDFLRMVKDAEEGKINCIITKDLSRLGRNYVQTGHYTDEVFMELGVRYIAINDGMDTEKDDNDIASFHHVINEFYPKQVSKKVRQVKASCARQGKFMGSQAPYGYRKSPEDKHLLIIDEEAANIVRRMFNEYASGYSGRMIAERLNAEGIDSPRFYHYRRSGRINPKAGERNEWSSNTILQLFRNEVYIGNMVQGMRQVISFKTKKRRTIDKDDWIVVTGTHEAIIEQALWDRVHDMLCRKEKVRTTKRGTIGMFSGKLTCVECKSPLAYMRKPLKTGEKGVYRCSRYNNNGMGACTSHYVDEAVLSAIVLSDIRTHARLAVAERERLKKQLLSEMSVLYDTESMALQSKMNEMENRLTDIASRIKSVYEDKCQGTIPEQVAIDLIQGFAKEQRENEAQKEILRTQMRAIQDAENDVVHWMDIIEKQIDITELSRSIVVELIDKIEVSEEHDESGKRRQEISIQYRFIGNLLGGNEKGSIA